MAHKNNKFKQILKMLSRYVSLYSKVLRHDFESLTV